MSEAVRKPVPHWTKPSTGNGSNNAAASSPAKAGRLHQPAGVKVELKELEKHHKELCLELNMDTEAVQASWASYVRVSNEHTLEVSFAIVYKNFCST